jgi:hypothetical protein
MFYFRMTRSENGVPVRIIEADAGGIETQLASTALKRRASLKNINAMRKRSLREFMEWADTVPLHELTSYGFSVKSHHVYENQSIISRDADDYGWDKFGQWNSSESADIRTRDKTEGLKNWKFDLRTDVALPHRHHIHNSHGKTSFRRATLHNSTSFPDTDRSYKNYTSTDIATATRIVEEAMNRSADYNKAHWENMSRNNYYLKLGTIIVGKNNASQSSVKKRSADLEFVVTPQIEAAAALLTEFEASGLSINNQTESGGDAEGEMRTEAAGSFWMESIARKGTVPWGNDPSYKVHSSHTT